MQELVKPNVGPAFRGRRLGYFRDEAAYTRYRQAYDRAMAELPPPAEQRDVKTGCGSVRAYRFGAGGGVPLLLLPGRAAPAPMWTPNLAGLAARRSVYAIDLLGDAGLSVQTRPLTGAADQASWLADALAALELRRVHLLGASFGGWTAFNLARHFPERLASVSLLDPASLFGRITWKVVVISAGAVVPGFPGSWRRRLLSWISGGADVSDDEPVAALISVGMRDFRSSLPAPAYPTDSQLASVKVPVLALIAGRSIIHNPGKAARRARGQLSGGTIELWPDASHAINGEFPDQVNTRVLTFIDSVEEASPR